MNELLPEWFQVGKRVILKYYRSPNNKRFDYEKNFYTKIISIEKIGPQELYYFRVIMRAGFPCLPKTWASEYDLNKITELYMPYNVIKK